MARSVSLALALVLLCGALAVCPTEAAFAKPNGQKDLTTALNCLRRKGKFSRFLHYFESSGFKKIVGNYLQSQPLTLLAFSDAAVGKLPARVVRQLRGAKLIKLLEMHMILNKFPADYFKKCLPTAFFDTALGDSVFKAKPTKNGAIVLSPTRDANPSRLATVTEENVCGNGFPTLIIQSLDTVLIPPSLFSSATH